MARPASPASSWATGPSPPPISRKASAGSGAASRADAVRPAQIGLVDDEPRLRAQLRAVLEDHEVVVVGEAGTGREGVELACRLQPQVVLMDLRMPELDGIAATRLLLARQPSAVVLILSAYDDPALMREARQAGARGYLVKGCRVGELVEAITSAAAAQAAAAPSGAGAVDRLEAGSSSG